jgi:hypothetical protein
MLTVAQIAEVLDRARDAALPGQQAAEQNATLRALRELLQPPKPPPLRIVR